MSHPGADRGRRLVLALVSIAFAPCGAHAAPLTGVRDSCPSDIDGGGDVGFGDLTDLLLHWGPCPVLPAECPWDQSGDGTTGFADMTALLLAWGPCPPRPCEPSWVPTFGERPGLGGACDAFTVFDDGSGSGAALYAGGAFSSAGNLDASKVVRWDGSSWSALGSGIDEAVESLAVFDDGDGADLYAGGWFHTAGGVSANRVARWDGSTWTQVGFGLSGPVFALTVFDDGSGPALFAGGAFTAQVAKWNGLTWSALGTEFLNGSVEALVVFDDGSGSGPALFAGGSFTSVGAVSVNRVAKWNGSTWQPLGSGMNQPVYCLTAFDDGDGPALYAGGLFTTAGGAPANRIARWDGSTWSALGTGMNLTVESLMVFDDGSGAGPALHAAGRFTNAGGVDANRVARWDGASWTHAGSGITGGSNVVSALGVYDDGTGPRLYAGGSFAIAGGAPSVNIARWDGSEWLPFSEGVSYPLSALTVFDDGSGAGAALYAGGNFIGAGGIAANKIARWDGSTWSALAGGTSGDVLTMQVFDDGSGSGAALYAGGSFSSADGVPGTNRIARWDGSSWSALSTGMNGTVLALTALGGGRGSESTLYAGGTFTTAGGVPANRVARWDGVSWSPLGSGIGPNSVSALALFDEGDGGGSVLFAGGSFISAGGSAANRVARWDGSSWSALGSGMNEYVRELAVFDDGSGPALYAGGGFTTAGGVAASNIARWDGSSWSAVGGGTNDAVSALFVHDDGSGPALYVGGAFTNAGGAAANRIARWDGSSWSALGSGVNELVSTLADYDDGSGPALFAGGSFLNAIDSGDSFLAKWGCR